MSSINDLYDKIQMLGEAKSAGYAKQAPVFKDVPKKMKAAGMAASSRDAMIFITQVLSRLDIIEPDIYEMAIKGQHKERMEKLMTILRSKEEEINAKSDEIVEYINQNLDNYTAGAGTDRNRAEKYKETAKAMSQEVQNIKAGKEADDALRDIAVTVSQGLDSDVTDEDIAALDFDEADIFINIPDANVKGEVAKKVADYLNGQGLKAEPTRAGVNIEAPTGFFGDNAMHAKFEDQLKGLVMRTDSNIGEDKIQVKFTGADGPVEVEDAENEAAFDAQKEKVKAMFDQQILDEVNAKVEKHAGEPDFDHDTEWLAALKSIHSHYKRYEGKDRFAAAERLLAKSDATLAKNVSVEDGEGKYDDGDNTDEKCDYVPCEDGEHELDDEAHEMLSQAEDILGNLEDQGHDDLAANGTEGAEGADADAMNMLYNLQDAGWTNGSAAWKLSRDIVAHGRKAMPETEDYEVVAESKYSTADNLLDIYASVKPIVETIVESTTVNENGQTSHTQQYIVEKAEAAIEEVYTNEYLTEQKASDSLLVPKEEVRESFKERYQPKTSYQLEELRRYGL